MSLRPRRDTYAIHRGARTTNHESRVQRAAAFPQMSRFPATVGPAGPRSQLHLQVQQLAHEREPKKNACIANFDANKRYCIIIIII